MTDSRRVVRVTIEMQDHGKWWLIIGEIDTPPVSGDTCQQIASALRRVTADTLSTWPPGTVEVRASGDCSFDIVGSVGSVVLMNTGEYNALQWCIRDGHGTVQEVAA